MSLQWPTEALAIRGRDAWTLIAICPVCSRETIHGGGPSNKPPAGGWRVCHKCWAQIELIPAEPVAKEGRKPSE